LQYIVDRFVPQVVVVEQPTSTEYHEITSPYALYVHLVDIVLRSLREIEIVRARRNHVPGITFVDSMDDVDWFQTYVHKDCTQDNRKGNCKGTK
jgi:hypothetical protein